MHIFWIPVLLQNT